ncbi:MAG: serine/threonine protein kinase [Steroidobacteraceae bacterium]
MIDERPFAGLAPEVVLDAVESLGIGVDGRLMALNSYENRVYRVGTEGPAGLESHPGIVADAIIVKFYRAGRWSDAQIVEEHQFAADLADAELSVAAPVARDGTTLHHWAGFAFAAFACWRGGAPELDLPGHRELLGRSLGRLHARAATRRFATRGAVSDWQCGESARRAVLASGHLPPPLDERYAEVSAQLVAAVRAAMDAAPRPRLQRLHGDCHLGNILWNAQGPVFVDLDDCLTGPAIQDLWMLCSGSPAQREKEWTELLCGYSQFASLDRGELALVEALRAIRMLNHAAWIAGRWRDPAFPLAFPWFAGPRYWERHLDELREQIAIVWDPPPLALW